MEAKLNEIEANGIVYVRKDSVKESNPSEKDGLKYAIVRSRNQGVMSGYVKSINGQAVTLVLSRQLFKWNSLFILSELAEYGINKADGCKFSTELSNDTIMLEACGILYCTEKACESIRGHKPEINE
jgi:hypothetical protein